MLLPVARFKQIFFAEPFSGRAGVSVKSNPNDETSEDSIDPNSGVSATWEEPELKQTSVAATVSFVFAIGALLTLVLVYPSIILSVMAILCGHIATRILKRSKGQRIGWGKARIGKLLGYFCLTIALVLLMFVGQVRLLVRGALESERTLIVGAGEGFSPGVIGDIERKLAAGDRTDFGNVESAQRLASKFRRELRQMLNQVLTRRDDRDIGLDTSGISACCHVGNGVCFIVSIPELTRFSGAADSLLNQAVWQAAVISLQSIAFESETRVLAVGLMETQGCQRVLWTSTWDDFHRSPSPQSIDRDRSKLLRVIEQPKFKEM